MGGDVMEISISRQHRQLVAQAELCQKGIDRANLDTRTATFVAQLRRLDVIGPVGGKHRQRSEAIEDAGTVARSGEALQQLLQYKTGGDQHLARFDRAN